jgi:hypothetical protein
MGQAPPDGYDSKMDECQDVGWVGPIMVRFARGRTVSVIS